MRPAVEIVNLSKSYQSGKNNVLALNDISFNVEDAEIFGLIGPDGAGKTSLFRILTTLILPNQGFAKVFGYDVNSDYQSIRNIVGYMPGKFSLYEDLSVEENLNFFASLFKTTVHENYHQIKDIYQQLEPFKKRRAGKLSGGMKQKLALCCALVHKPRILFLDEPTTGVDPVSRTEFWAMLKKLKSQGITILVSTPYMDEAGLCDRIAFIQEGMILSVVNPDLLIRSYNKKIWSVSGKNRYQLIEDVRSHSNTAHCIAFGSSHHLDLKHETEDSIDDLRQFLSNKGHSEFSITPISGGLEDYFLELLSKKVNN